MNQRKSTTTRKSARKTSDENTTKLAEAQVNETYAIIGTPHERASAAYMRELETVSTHTLDNLIMASELEQLLKGPVVEGNAVARAGEWIMQLSSDAGINIDSPEIVAQVFLLSIRAMQTGFIKQPAYQQDANGFNQAYEGIKEILDAERTRKAKRTSRKG